MNCNFNDPNVGELPTNSCSNQHSSKLYLDPAFPHTIGAEREQNTQHMIDGWC